MLPWGKKIVQASVEGHAGVMSEHGKLSAAEVRAENQ
jgi:hypothetical protein